MARAPRIQLRRDALSLRRRRPPECGRPPADRRSRRRRHRIARAFSRAVKARSPLHGSRDTRRRMAEAAEPAADLVHWTVEAIWRMEAGQRRGSGAWQEGRAGLLVG